jgi:hypothetical protein
MAARVMALKEEGVWVAVVACGDAAPILEPAEHDLDAVALAVKRLVAGDRLLAALFQRHAGGDAAAGESGAEAATILAAVGDAFAGGWKLVQQQGSAAMIPGLAFGEQQRNGASLAVADGVEFRLPPALGAPSPPLVRPRQRSGPPFCGGWRRCDAPCGAWHRPSGARAGRPRRRGLRRCGRTHPCGLPPCGRCLRLSGGSGCRGSCGGHSPAPHRASASHP